MKKVVSLQEYKEKKPKNLSVYEESIEASRRLNEALKRMNREDK